MFSWLIVGIATAQAIPFPSPPCSVSAARVEICDSQVCDLNQALDGPRPLCLLVPVGAVGQLDAGSALDGVPTVDILVQGHLEVVGALPAAEALLYLHTDVNDGTLTWTPSEEGSEIKSTLWLQGAEVVQGAVGGPAMPPHALVASGGKLFVDDSDVTLSAAHTGLGGAVFGKPGSTVVWRNVVATFASPTLPESGGVIYTEGALHLDGVSIDGAAVSQDGGAIYLKSDAVATLTDVTITHGTAGMSGGAVYVGEGASLAGTDVTIDMTTAVYGGAVMLKGSATLDNATLSASRAWQHGGAVYVHDGVLASLTDVRIQSPVAERGAAIYTRGQLTMTRGAVCGAAFLQGAPGTPPHGSVVYAYAEAAHAHLFNVAIDQPAAAAFYVDQARWGSADITLTNVTVRRAPSPVWLVAAPNLDDSLITVAPGSAVPVAPGAVALEDDDVIWLPHNPAFDPCGVSFRPHPVTNDPLITHDSESVPPVGIGGGDAASRWWSDEASGATDADNDGWDHVFDCDDQSADLSPSAQENCDGLDLNCDGLVDVGCDSDEPIHDTAEPVDTDVVEEDTDFGVPIDTGEPDDGEILLGFELLNVRGSGCTCDSGAPAGGAWPALWILAAVVGGRRRHATMTSIGSGLAN